MPSKKPASCVRRSRFGQNVAKLREERKMTQEALAEGVGVSTRYLQSVEAGDYWPSLPTLAGFKGVLACSWEDLLAGCEKG